MFIFTLSTLSAQTNAVKANPLGLAVGFLNAGYEFGVADTQSVMVSAAYYDNLGINGFGLDASYRFYFGDEVLKGWHAEPVAGALFLSDAANTSATVFNFGATAGYQWVFGSGFLIDVYGGYTYATGGKSLAGFDAGLPVLGFAIGYAW
ncbi:MAG: DUF3575 domain-containing protein [Polaribacter sp.]|nr:DUF3575 domain-containing protein [Polaribacter sp.]